MNKDQVKDLVSSLRETIQGSGYYVTLSNAEVGALLAYVESLEAKVERYEEALREASSQVHLMRLPMMGPETKRTFAETIERVILAAL